MNLGPNFIELFFGKTLGGQIAGTALSTDGLRRFTTKALLGELQRRFEELESSGNEPNAAPKLDQWLPMEEIARKHFKGVKPEVIAKYLFMIGHPYRLQKKGGDADAGVEKIFLVDTMPTVTEAFDRNSRKLSCNGIVGIFFHPIVGQYERIGCTCMRDPV